MKKLLTAVAGAMLAGVTLCAADQTPVAPEIPAVATGESAPELSGVWTQGKPVKLSDQKGKKVTVLYFWTVNQPTISDIPRMSEVVKRYSSKPVTFIGVGCDDAKKVAEFFRAKELSMPILADDKYDTLRKFLRPSDRVPLAVVVDKSGRLVWRGNSAALSGLLDKVLSGDFDLKEHIRREKFSEAVSAALSKSHYEEAIKLIDEELERHPGNLELISVRVNLLMRALKRPDEALKTVNAELKRSPKELALYELKLKLLRAADKPELMPEFYDQICAAFPDKPMVLLRFADAEMNQPVRDSRPELFHRLMTAAYNSPKFKDDREKGLVTLAYARMLYFCGCPDLALSTSKRALILLKNKPEYDEARALVSYFNRVSALSKKLKE